MASKLKIGITAAVAGFLAFTIATSVGAWGSRGTCDEYLTKYRGKPAIVKKIDRRLTSDAFYLELDGGKTKIESGEIMTDDGKIIKIWEEGYSVKNYQK